MTDLDLISIGAKHSTPGQFSREFTEEQWISAARAIESAATAPLLERIAELEQRAELAEQAHVCAAEERDHLRQMLKELEAKLAQQAEAQDPFGFVWLEDGEWQLGTAFNGGPPLNAKAVFTRPQPAQIQRLGKDEWASVFRDASAAFFSDGCKNLTEQVNACAHAAMRATEFALEAKNGAVLK